MTLTIGRKERIDLKKLWGWIPPCKASDCNYQKKMDLTSFPMNSLSLVSGDMLHEIAFSPCTVTSGRNLSQLTLF